MTRRTSAGEVKPDDLFQLPDGGWGEVLGVSALAQPIPNSSVWYTLIAAWPTHPGRAAPSACPPTTH